MWPNSWSVFSLFVSTSLRSSFFHLDFPRIHIMLRPLWRIGILTRETRWVWNSSEILQKFFRNSSRIPLLSNLLTSFIFSLLFFNFCSNKLLVVLSGSLVLLPALGNSWWQSSLPFKKCVWKSDLESIQIRGHSITTWTRWGGKGVKKWQNYVQVVVDCSLTTINE